MGVCVRAKRVEILDKHINLSFALDFLDSDTSKSLNGLFKVEGGDILVGCTEKGRLCMQGSALNLDWLTTGFELSFTDSVTGATESVELNTETLLNATIDNEIGSIDSDVVGIGLVGYMKLRS